jgi:hypothetical protein
VNGRARPATALLAAVAVLFVLTGFGGWSGLLAAGLRQGCRAVAGAAR